MGGQPTIKQVAALAGVSPSTVSRVLNGKDEEHMTPETKEKVLAAIEKLDYTPLRAARSLRRQRSQVFAVLVPDISNPFFALLARGVESVAFRAGYAVLIGDSNHSVARESRHLSLLLAERVEGVVFIPVAQPDMDAIRRLSSSGARVVVVDRQVPGLPTVGVDNRAGSALLAEHLLKLGYRAIAYIAGPEGVSTAHERLEGFAEALGGWGVAPVCVHHGGYTYESGYSKAKNILERERPDAVVAANDLMAIGAMTAAEECGLRVPDDLGIAGFDRVPWAELIRPWLTTVEVPISRMGSEAAQMLLDSSIGSLQLPVKLIPGETCARKREGR